MMFQLRMDISGDGSYAENLTPYVTGPIEAKRRLDLFGHIADEPTMTVLLDNQDRRFSPENQHSPLYGHLHGNIAIRLYYGDTPLWTGRTEVFKPTPMRYGERLCELTCRGLNHRLKAVDTIVGLFRDQTFDIIIQHLLRASGIEPPNKRPAFIVGESELGDTTYLYDQIFDFDTGKTIIPIAGHQYRTQYGTTDVFRAIQEVTESERGRVWWDRDGNLVVKNRHAWSYNPTVDYVADNDFSEPPEYSTPEKHLRNRINVRGELPITDNAVGIVWQNTAPVILQPYEVRELYAEPRNPSGNPIGVDDLSEPSGGDFVVTSGSATVALDNTGGSLVKLILTGGENGAVVDTIILRGKEIKTHSIEYIASDQASIDKYGVKSESITIPILSTPTSVQSFAIYELARRSDDTPLVEQVVYERAFQEIQDDDPHIHLDIGSVMRVIDDQTGHDRIYRVIGITRLIDVPYQTMLVEYDLEPNSANGANWWVLGDSPLGINTYLGF